MNQKSSTKEPDDAEDTTSTFRRVVTFAFAVGIGAGICAAITYTMKQLTDLGFRVAEGEADHVPSEIKLTALLIIGAMTLILALVLAALAYRVVNKKAGDDEQSHALGLPEGSVSAVLALMLVLIFSITTVYLYQNLSDRERQGVVATGLSQQQVQGVAPDRIVSSAKELDGTYTVVTRGENTASNDFAKSAMTTLGTLLVAVVGFYFGARTSQSSTQKAVTAVGKVRQEVSQRPSALRNGKPATERGADGAASNPADSGPPPGQTSERGAANGAGTVSPVGDRG